MSEQNKTLVRRLTEEVWNRGNFAVADELVASDYIGHSPTAPGGTHGIEGYKSFFIALRNAFPDIRVSIEDEIAEGDKVSTRWEAQGTHKGEFAGIPPTGKHGVITGTSTFHISNGKVKECWTNADDLGLMQMIGVVPARANQ